MDKQGNGLEISQCHLGRCRSLGDVFTEEKFRYMCILSGCDYLPSLYGIGLGKACKLLRMANNPDILTVSYISTLIHQYHHVSVSPYINILIYQYRYASVSRYINISIHQYHNTSVS